MPGPSLQCVGLFLFLVRLTPFPLGEVPLQSYSRIIYKLQRDLADASHTPRGVTVNEAE